jgi:hypothetical protein
MAGLNMGFTELNEKIRDDYTRCLDTVLNGAQKIIDFMNKTAGKEQPTESSNGEFLNKFANAAIGAAIDNTPLKGLRLALLKKTQAINLSIGQA